MQLDPTPVDGPPAAADLAATPFIEKDDPAVRVFAHQAVAGTDDEYERISRLFVAVRDGFRYDPFSLPTTPEGYRASAVLAAGRGFCVNKSVLLAAAARALGIPARLGFADVRNHLQTERLAERMGTDEFVYHGYTTLFVGEAWRKASPAFNAELCERSGVPPLEFDGRSDALLHAFDGDGGRYMEYLTDHGTYAELPYALLTDTYRRAYPRLTEPEPGS